METIVSSPPQEGTESRDQPLLLSRGRGLPLSGPAPALHSDRMPAAQLPLLRACLVRPTPGGRGRPRAQAAGGTCLTASSLSRGPAVTRTLGGRLPTGDLQKAHATRAAPLSGLRKGSPCLVSRPSPPPPRSLAQVGSRNDPLGWPHALLSNSPPFPTGLGSGGGGQEVGNGS